MSYFTGNLVSAELTSERVQCNKAGQMVCPSHHLGDYCGWRLV